MFRGKNYKESAKLVDKANLYDPADAFALGLHLGLSLLCDQVRRVRPQQVQ